MVWNTSPPAVPVGPPVQRRVVSVDPSVVWGCTIDRCQTQGDACLLSIGRPGRPVGRVPYHLVDRMNHPKDTRCIAIAPICRSVAKDRSGGGCIRRNWANPCLLSVDDRCGDDCNRQNWVGPSKEKRTK